MDAFDPDYTPNHDDHMLRYSFNNQPTIIWKNLVRLVEHIAELFTVPIVDDPEFIAVGVKEADADDLVKRAEAITEDVGNEYKTMFLTEYGNLMAQRMVFKTCKDTDTDTMFSPCLDLMQKYELDFHHISRRLRRHSCAESFRPARRRMRSSLLRSSTNSDEAKTAVLVSLHSYSARLTEEGVEDEDCIPAMEKLNPKFVPKLGAGCSKGGEEGRQGGAERCGRDGDKTI